MATIDINVSSQIPNLTRVTLQALVSGSNLSTQKWYIITDAVGATKRIGVMATGVSTLSNAAVNLTDGTFGSYDITTDVYTASAGGSFVPYTGATGNVDLGAFFLMARELAVSTVTAGTADVGKMAWNDSEGTIEFKLKNGNVTLQLGQEQVARVVNKTGGNLLEADYQCVYVSGAQGQRIKVNLAKADSATTCENTLGLVTETINNNQEGFITTAGLVNNINTTGSLQGETWADGDVLYLSQATAGRITNIAPTSGIIVVVGYCVHAHATQGKIFVNINVKLEQPFIPLAGTAAGKPVTGNIEISNAIGGFSLYQLVSSINSYLEIEGGVNIKLLSQNVSSGDISKIVVSPSYCQIDNTSGDLSSALSTNVGSAQMNVGDLGTGDNVSLEITNQTALINSTYALFEGLKYSTDYSPNFTNLSLINLITLKKRLWTKAGTPTTTDDVNAGFVVGSLIWDTTNSILYRCTSNTAGAATWTTAITGGVTDGNKGDVTVASSGTSWTVTRFQGRPFSSAAPATGQAIIWNGTTWIPTSISHSANASPAGTLAAGLTRYIVVQGSNAIATGEGSLQQVVPKAITTISASCYLVITTAIVGAASLTLRKNGVDTGLVITIPSGATTGIFTGTGAVSFNATDLWSWKAVGATTNSIQINNITLDYE